MRRAQKKTWPDLKAAWTEFDTRDQVVDFITRLEERTEIPLTRLLGWMEMGRSKFHDWRERYGKVNEHNGKVPRDWWLEDWEKRAIWDFFIQHSSDGYRRLTYMMMDADVVACAPSTVYRALSEKGFLLKSTAKPSKKGTGFVQPTRAHQEWHIDVTYLNISGTFYYLCSVLDGFSRFIVHWEIREAMKEPDVELIVQRALEKFPGMKPKLISDNGPQFIAKDFKEFIRLSGMTHVRTSPYYPQSNGKQERMQGTVKRECIREKNPATVEEARKLVATYVGHYNTERLHSAIGYVTPLDKLEGRAEAIQSAREIKLARAREQRKANRSGRAA
mgnify:FL=1